MAGLRFDPGPRSLVRAARTAIGQCLKVAPGERVLIVTNPGREVRVIAQALYDAAAEARGIPSLLCQPRKTQLDFAEPSVFAALATRPEVFISVTEDKIGRDRQGTRAPYEAEGRKYDNLLRYLLYGERCLRAFWSPSVTRSIFRRTVTIDYEVLRRRCAHLKPVLDSATGIRLDSPAGTQLHLGAEGRISRADDGDFRHPGCGGNLPAGELFLSPQPGTARGRLVFDGSMAVTGGAVRVRRPITVELRDGFITEIRGGREAGALEASIRRAESRAREMEHEGSLAQGLGEIYARNARALGELGIGLNPRARIEGNVLNDEKVYGTCHLAVGFNLDEDAPALIHLDGLVRRPTLTAILPGGEQTVLMREGRLPRV
jgi:aminopeptidase